MVPKSLSFNLHLHPHPSFPSAISRINPRPSNFVTTTPLLSSTTITIRSNTTHDQSNFHHLSLGRSPIFTTMASTQHNPSPKFDEFESDPTLTNDDLKPTTLDQRTFSRWELASLWVGLVVGVPTYYLAGSLVDLGMAWWQGIATVVAANIILLVPLVLTGHPGTKYGISFPVLARSSFGIYGAHIPTLLRALVGCGWYGIETWIGGEAIFILLPNSIKQSSLSQVLPWLGTSPLEFGCFIVFWLAQLAIVWKGMDGISIVYFFMDYRKTLLGSCGVLPNIWRDLSMKDLYSVSPFGEYYYSGGYNLAAMAALVVGILPVVPGFLQKIGLLSSISDAYVIIYNNAWFFSFFSAGLLYWLLSSLKRKQNSLPTEEPLLPPAN
ncbi:purine-uracil permease NCS1-like [Prunus avium]|uniref:Purine-uracil permease NCS1-like n=1 Tax=Prunus avium TaxID=42229 RepID=A0A6P5TUD7_PRUAV|nr:purine-uracil permease NCS1-like [Prunus avium]